MRKAIHTDVPRMLELGARMHEESRYRRFQLNLAKAREFFHAAIDNGSAIVLVDGEPLCAMFVGFVQPFWWGDDLESFDLLLYVLPENRGGRYAMRLVRAYTALAEQMGAQDIKIGVSTGVDSERTIRLFERLGFRAFSSGLEYAEAQTVH